jgi:hypothetical protein
MFSEPLTPILCDEVIYLGAVLANSVAASYLFNTAVHQDFNT